MVDAFDEEDEPLLLPDDELPDEPEPDDEPVLAADEPEELLEPEPDEVERADELLEDEETSDLMPLPIVEVVWQLEVEGVE